jgi:hypothetical protein
MQAFLFANAANQKTEQDVTLFDEFQGNLQRSGLLAVIN